MSAARPQAGIGGEELLETQAAFDSVAADYDGPRGNNTLIQRMRATMWRSSSGASRAMRGSSTSAAARDSMPCIWRRPDAACWPPTGRR